MADQTRPTFVETGLKSSITEFALALVASKDRHYFASGTASLIASNLAITAKHVVTDLWQQYEKGDFHQGEYSGTFSLQACQLFDKGEVGALRNVTKLWLSPHTDVAFLNLSAPGERYRHRPSLRMNLLPPTLGSRIQCFGYHSSSITLTETAPSELTIEWKDSPTTSVGTVIELHDARRDSYRLNFPCFRTDARFDGGMSGGPVFNDAGQLVGVVCSSLPPSVAGEEYASYVACLWPAMATVIDMDREGYPPGLSYPALGLAKHGFIAALNWDRIELIGQESSAIKSVLLHK